jgi:RimJ/RimL family protein N-acetyltransferase
MASNDCRIYIAIKGRRRIGQIRFDIDSAGMAETDVALAVETRGRGCGTDLIREGCRILFAEPQVRACVAHVKIKNEASRRAFQRAGFHEVGVKRLKGQTVRELMLRRSRKREVGQANPGVL